VNFVLSDEQEELRRSVRRFLEDKSPITEVRRLMETAEGYDPKVWAQMGNELGLQSLHIPEAYGGQGYSFVELVVVLEEMGRALLCSPYYASVCLAANAIMNAGTEEQKQALLPGIASGDTIATLAFTEPNGRWDASGITMEAVPTGGPDASGDFTLSGTKMFVLDGHTAGLVVVAARRPGSEGTDGISFFTVDGGAEGLTRTALPTMDQTRKLCEVTLDDTPATLLGAKDAGWAPLDRVVQRATVALCAEMCGGAQKVLDMTTEYAKIRIAFGKPIGSYQGVKHRAADMLVDVENAKSLTYYAAWAVDENVPEAALACSMAKAYTSDAYRKVAGAGIQLHGGIGFTWEHDLHLYFKRAKSSEFTFGDATYHREKVAQLISL
jgi:alkylation response protein AidB-like acyl-CoA dehydrogenase